MGRTDDNTNLTAATAVDPSDAVMASTSNVEIALVPSGYCVAHFTRAPVSWPRPESSEEVSQVQRGMPRQFIALLHFLMYRRWFTGVVARFYPSRTPRRTVRQWRLRSCQSQPVTRRDCGGCAGDCANFARITARRPLRTTATTSGVPSRTSSSAQSWGSISARSVGLILGVTGKGWSQSTLPVHELQLRNVKCSFENCGATGDDAHTRNYCPKLTIEEKLLRSLPSVLAATKMQASGVRRQN